MYTFIKCIYIYKSFDKKAFVEVFLSDTFTKPDNIFPFVLLMYKGGFRKHIFSFDLFKSL